MSKLQPADEWGVNAEHLCIALYSLLLRVTAGKEPASKGWLWGHPFEGSYKAVLVEGVEFGNGENVSQQLGRKQKPERASAK